MTFLEPIPDRLRDDELRALRSTAMRARAAYGPKDSVRDALSPDVTEPFLEAIDRLLRELAREANRGAIPRPASCAQAATVAGGSPSSSGLNASSRNGDGTSGSYRSVRVRRARVHAT